MSRITEEGREAGGKLNFWFLYGAAMAAATIIGLASGYVFAAIVFAFLAALFFALAWHDRDHAG